MEIQIKATVKIQAEEILINAANNHHDTVMDAIRSMDFGLMEMADDLHAELTDLTELYFGQEKSKLQFMHMLRKLLTDGCLTTFLLPERIMKLLETDHVVQLEVYNKDVLLGIIEDCDIQY